MILPLRVVHQEPALVPLRCWNMRATCSLRIPDIRRKNISWLRISRVQVIIAFCRLAIPLNEMSGAERGSDCNTLRPDVMATRKTTKILMPTPVLIKEKPHRNICKCTSPEACLKKAQPVSLEAMGANLKFERGGYRHNEIE